MDIAEFNKHNIVSNIRVFFSDILLFIAGLVHRSYVCNLHYCSNVYCCVFPIVVITIYEKGVLSYESVVSRILPAIVVMLFVGFIAYIHFSGLRPSFSVFQENNISNLKTGEVLYFGSSGCGACQEFNKVLKEYQDETHVKIYYWDATDMKIVRKAAEIKQLL